MPNDIAKHRRRADDMVSEEHLNQAIEDLTRAVIRLNKLAEIFKQPAKRNTEQVSEEKPKQSTTLKLDEDASKIYEMLDKRVLH